MHKMYGRRGLGRTCIISPMYKSSWQIIITHCQKGLLCCVTCLIQLWAPTCGQCGQCGYCGYKLSSSALRGTILQWSGVEWSGGAEPCGGVLVVTYEDYIVVRQSPTNSNQARLLAKGEVPVCLTCLVHRIKLAIDND
jgi:hypothetical protein